MNKFAVCSTEAEGRLACIKGYACLFSEVLMFIHTYMYILIVIRVVYSWQHLINIGVHKIQTNTVVHALYRYMNKFNYCSFLLLGIVLNQTMLRHLHIHVHYYVYNTFFLYRFIQEVQFTFVLNDLISLICHKISFKILNLQRNHSISWQVKK